VRLEHLLSGATLFLKQECFLSLELLVYAICFK